MMPSSVSVSWIHVGFHASGTCAPVEGRHPHLQNSLANLLVTATCAGAVSGMLMARSTSTTSAAAACAHVIAMPSPSGRGACASRRDVRSPACPMRASPRRLATSIVSHAFLPIGNAAP